MEHSSFPLDKASPHSTPRPPASSPSPPPSSPNSPPTPASSVIPGTPV
ncbi:hypothetical protein LOK49_LG01G00466 [Camellia lanceoleosa]|uniref:Uncharacterized protein n=1 Tax=Camellia lanceoleosa TaxID=1840588 RepID=A0ACC0IWP5_9ERIC|nr:hypothetical protein LOK49_LG01G00466 [Camellia lanceoleosa]